MKYSIATSILLLIGVLGGCNLDNTKQKENEEIKSKGLSIISNTFIALSTELQKSMSEGGVAKAVKYCNVEALPITDSLSNKYGVKIKRTSDRIRNPKNMANQEEISVIESYKKLLSSDGKLSPMIKSHKTETMFYAPIIANELCLKCHGNKKDIDEYSIITDLYPDDLATGYMTGDLRGIWSIKFIK